MSSAITRLNPSSLPDAGAAGYSQISIAAPGPLAFVSGQVAWRADGGDIPETLADQTEIVLHNLRGALAALSAGPESIVQMRIYVTDLTPERQDVVMGPLAAFLGEVRPSLTGIGVAALAGRGLQVEIEMVVQVAS